MNLANSFLCDSVVDLCDKHRSCTLILRYSVNFPRSFLILSFDFVFGEVLKVITLLWIT